MSEPHRRDGTSRHDTLVVALGILLSGCMEPALIGGDSGLDEQHPIPPHSAYPPLTVRDTTFVKAWAYSISYSPIALALGDVDGDHQLDIVAVNSYLTNIGVGLGSGHGTLLDMNPKWAHAPSTSVAMGLADLDHDGILDVIVGHHDLGGSILYGKVGGHVGSPVLLPCSGATSGLAVADFNGDGMPDIVMADSDSSSICINFSDKDSGSYTMQLVDVGDQSTSPVVGDFDGDGLPDLAVAHVWGKSVAVLYGDGRGTFSAPHYLPTDIDPRGLVSRDVNSDGRADLLVVHPETSTLRLFTALGREQWQSTELTAHLAPIAAVIEDFNGDGAMDLAVANYVSSDVSLLIGDGKGNFEPPVHFYSGEKPMALATGDFDGDRRPDLVVGNYTTATVRLLLNAEKNPSPRQ